VCQQPICFAATVTRLLRLKPGGSASRPLNRKASVRHFRSNAGRALNPARHLNYFAAVLFPACCWRLTLTIEVEAKAMELVALRLRHQLLDHSPAPIRQRRECKARNRLAI
jgi:hypothetical protein